MGYRKKEKHSESEFQRDGKSSENAGKWQAYENVYKITKKTIFGETKNNPRRNRIRVYLCLFKFLSEVYGILRPFNDNQKTVRIQAIRVLSQQHINALKFFIKSKSLVASAITIYFMEYVLSFIWCVSMCNRHAMLLLRCRSLGKWVWLTFDALQSRMKWFAVSTFISNKSGITATVQIIAHCIMAAFGARHKRHHNEIVLPFSSRT